MKFQGTCLVFFTVWIVVTLSALEVSAETATLSVSPPAVSNTYPGVITLQIGGLTNGEPVTVQTYLDLNQNGVVDAGEPLLDTFKITDGKASVINGITNLNVPFDSDPATGAITATLSFAPLLESIVGQKIYRVASPSGNFTPVTFPLVVTNATLAQAVTGTVFRVTPPLNTVAVAPNALVLALLLPNNNYSSAAVADSNGNYFLKLNPGNYQLVAYATNAYQDGNIAPQVVLTNGMTAANNLYLTNAAVTVSGQVYDAANSNTLGGVFLLLNQNNLETFALTDTNGDYTAGVTSNNWKVKVTSQRLARRAYVVPQATAVSANTTLGNFTNANIALSKGNALVYGRITDVSNHPLPNIDINGYDFFNIFKASGYSDTNGDYTVAVFGGTNVWGCGPGSDNLTLANDIVNDLSNTTLSSNQTLLQNFIALPINATISGYLLNNNGQPVVGVSVGAYTFTNDTNNYTTVSVQTDATGYFSFGAASGQWSVTANTIGSHTLAGAGYYDPNQHIVNIPPTNWLVDITAYPTNLTLLSQPEIISASQFGFNLNGASGNNYTVQASTNLATTNWFTVTVVSNLVGNSFFIEDNQATNAQRFYRVMNGP